MNKLFGLALIGAALAACNPHLTQQSVAPPGRSARLDKVDGFWGTKYYRLEVSTGVALAITCERGTPCEKMNVISDDPAIAEVRLASLSALQRNGFGLDQLPSSAFVIVGKTAGTTRLHVRAKEGKRDVVVTVVPPPIANPQTVAQPPAKTAEK